MEIKKEYPSFSKLTKETQEIISEMLEKELIKEEVLHGDEYYLSTLAFQYKFLHGFNTKPTPLSEELSSKRFGYLVEEVVEFLHAAAKGNEEKTKELVDALKKSIDNSLVKQLEEGEYEDKSEEYQALRQYDALIDILYFLNGTFNVFGLSASEGFKEVQNANMKKLGPDGNPIFNPVTNKVMKPEGWEQFAPEPKLLEIIKNKMK